MVSPLLVAEPKSAPRSMLPLVDLVHDVVRSSVVRVHPTLEEEGITMGQFWALHTVSSLEAASLSTVARYLGVSPPTVCANIDQLEASGLVRRARSEKDRRSIELSLTPRGRRVEAHVWAEIARVMSGAAEAIPEEDVRAAVRVFQQLARRLASGSRGGPP